MIHQTKQVAEFGATVTLHRITDDDGKRGTLWHRSQERALSHWKRLAPIKGWS